LRTSKAELGDVGYCTAACAAHDSCDFADSMFCWDVGLLTSLGVGYCLTAAPCTNDQKCQANMHCFDTVLGKRCLQDDGQGNPLFPLGKASP